jgi:ribose transport system ATP-binding protein
MVVVEEAEARAAAAGAPAPHVAAASVPAPADSGPPLFELKNISKRFPGVIALDDVSLEIRAGEVHVLLGENGAGKSSLMKILCGAYTADAGEFFHQGAKVTVSSPADARRYGIAVIFQEFTLVPYLNIAQNIFLGREFPGRIPGTVDHARMHAEAQKLLDLLGMEHDTHTLAHTLGVAQQQMVEIAKALSQNARILVLDEPTSALSDRETERLFSVIKKLQSQGVAMVYISHRLAEVFLLGDRITVLRDGKRVAERLPGETTPDDLVSLMVGRKVDMTYARDFSIAPGAAMLEVKNMCAANGVTDINLTVRAGEIVGLSGLVGAGRSEVARAIFGADKVTAGEVWINGQRMHGGPNKAVKLGVGLIPESRKQEGLALIRSVGDNLLLASMKRLFPSRWFNSGVAEKNAAERIEQLHIATPGPQQLVQFLSGGNQQKVVIGKWLSAQSKLFIFDEPTRGIDVGAKAEIFAVIDQLVRAGAGVLMISSELSEIVKVCDRSYVMRDGRIVGELKRAELSEESILRLGMHDG